MLMRAILTNSGLILRLKIMVHADGPGHGPASPPTVFLIVSFALIACVSNAARVKNSGAHLLAVHPAF